MISVKSISKIYGSTTVLDDLSFDIKEGEVVGFLGPNGAGKTTTMRIITGYIQPSVGEVQINGEIIADKALHLRREIGYLPENNPLYENMRVYEYLEYVARMKAVVDPASEIRQVVQATQLAEKLTASISELSKGYRQRVGLADALLGNPDILILDEPTSGLDPNQAAEIRKLIRKIGKTKTVIFSTHILQEVRAVCDRVLIINKGEIVGQGTVDELVHKSQGRQEIVVRIEGDSKAVRSQLITLPGIENVAAEADSVYRLISSADHNSCRDIFNACVKNKWILLQMQTSELSLEDVFRQLTTS